MAAKKPKPGSGQIEQLRARILALRDKLEQEARQRKLHMDLAKASKDARTKIAHQVEVLKKRGESLAKQLREAIAEGEKREKKVRDEAFAKVAELRKELALKAAELKRKSAELSKLAMESAERARAIITEAPETPGDASANPPVPVQPAAPQTPKPPES
jgi:hypothetical protein